MAIEKPLYTYDIVYVAEVTDDHVVFFILTSFLNGCGRDKCLGCPHLIPRREVPAKQLLGLLPCNDSARCRALYKFIRRIEGSAFLVE